MTDIVVGEIIEVSPEGEATIKATISLDDYTRKGYRKVMIYLQDSRSLSDKQRRFCYALIADIADWMGEHAKSADREIVKQYLKLRHISENMEPMAAHLFSMSNAPMDVINDFLRFLIEFILQNDIPTKTSLLNYVDENSIQSYIYSCIMNKKCCICGKPSDLHHITKIGMGGNRDDTIHEGLEVISLCRSHHQEVHSIGEKEFNLRYHLDGGIIVDKTLCRLYHLKAKKET